MSVWAERLSYTYCGGTAKLFSALKQAHTLWKDTKPTIARDIHNGDRQETLVLILKLFP